MRAAQLSALIFGVGSTAASLSQLSKDTGIPASTLSEYRNQPEKIPLGRLRQILKARRVPVDEVIKVLGK